MIVYYIDALNRKVIEKELGEDTPVHSLLPGGICLAARLNNLDVIYVDDTGLMQTPYTKAFRVKGSRMDDQPMMSDGIVTGADVWTDELCDHVCAERPLSSIAEIEAIIEWVPIEEAVKWFSNRRNSPAITMTTFGNGETQVLSTWGDIVKIDD